MNDFAGDRVAITEKTCCLRHLAFLKQGTDPAGGNDFTVFIFEIGGKAGAEAQFLACICEHRCIARATFAETEVAAGHDMDRTEIAHQLDLPVVSVDYRLAPEHPFPAAPDDCEAAARWIASSPAELDREITGLVITGDSAGGNLTIVTTNQLVNEPAAVPVVVQAPIYPVASDLSRHSSLAMFAEGFLLTGAAMAWFTSQYGGDASDPRHTPMVGDCSDTPPTVVCTAGLDPLRDSGREYAAHLVQLGTETVYLEFPGIIHGFTTLRKAIPSGQNDLEAFLDAVKLMVERHR